MKIQNFHKRKLFSTLATALTLTSCQSMNSSKSSSEDAAKNPSEIVVSNYKGGKITLQDVNTEIEKLVVRNNKLKGLTFDQLNSDQKETVIKEAVLNNIIYKEGKKRNFNDEEDYQAALKIFETELLKQKLFAALVTDAKKEENVRKNYDDLVNKIKDKQDIKLSYIALNTSSEAESLSKILERYPNSFSDQAKRKSVDKETAKNGGELGFVFEDSLPKEVVSKAKELGKDQISKPFAANGKWIIIKLEDKRPAEISSFEKAKDALAQSLAQKAIEDFISKSLEDAKINVVIK